MNDKYKINDTRDLASFKTETFSGFKKTDVINAVIKSIEAKKIEQACFWTTESIVSGYSLILWEKLINYSCKVININNPELPYFIMKKNKVLYNQINNNPLISSYINYLGNKLSRNIMDDDRHYTFFVVQSDQVNAFAVPGGFIGINAGLITLTENAKNYLSDVAKDDYVTLGVNGGGCSGFQYVWDY